LVRTVDERTLYLDLLDPERFRQLTAAPERLEAMLAAAPSITRVVVDEIQRVPGLLPVVHRLIELKKGVQFVLTGSSSRKLKRTGADLLAGRAVLRTLHPFMASELGSRFELERALTVGLLPAVWGAEDPRDVLRAYAALYLREEVQQEGLVRRIEGFSRFLEAIAFSHASLLSISNVARDCQVERKLVENYVTILEDILLAFRLPVFARRARRAVVAHPKFYLFDAGVYRSLRPAGPLDDPGAIEGQALEGLIAQHLRAWAAYSGEDVTLHFWRTRAGSEVDFVLYGPIGLWGIEVKNSRTIRPEDVRGLTAFKDEYPESRTVLLYRGTDALMRGPHLCLPCDVFVRQLKPKGPLIPG